MAKYDSIDFSENNQTTVVPSRLSALLDRSQSRLIPSRWEQMRAVNSKKNSVSKDKGYESLQPVLPAYNKKGAYHTPASISQRLTISDI